MTREPMAGMFPPYIEDDQHFTCSICFAPFVCHTVAPFACPNCGHDYTQDRGDDDDET